MEMLRPTPRIASHDGLLTVGRDERYWDAALDTLCWWNGNLSDDIVVLAPHPDDEVLGCAGLLQRCARTNARIELWTISDGEGCFGRVAGRDDIARLRRHEAEEAHRRLGLSPEKFTARWLGLPDGEVSRHTPLLHAALNMRLKANTSLIAPLTMDGHSDNDAIGTVARELAQERHLTLISYPVWFWHWGDCALLKSITGAGCRLALTGAEELKKREAIAAFHSQIYSISRDEAVLPRRMLRHFRRSFEVFFRENHKSASLATPPRY